MKTSQIGYILDTTLRHSLKLQCDCACADNKRTLLAYVDRNSTLKNVIAVVQERKKQFPVTDDATFL
jgi:hypothetical protein